MATMSLNPFCNGRHDNDSLETAFLRPKTGLDDKRLESVCDPSPQFSSWPRLVTLQEIGKYITNTELSNLVCDGLLLDIEPPPPYTTAVTDAPPSYEIHRLPNTSQDTTNLKSKTWHGKDNRAFPWPTGRLQTPTPPILSMTPASIDFNDTSTFRQAAKKKDKKAQQKAAQDKWADDGGDGANGGGEGGDNTGGGGEGGGAGGGGGGGSNNGDGGAGEDGGGDEWNTGGGKKKKKGKKNKNTIDEEEEQKEKEEEEKKGMAESGMGEGQDLSWMDDPVGKPGDEWAGFTSTEKKGKKNKKGKVEAAPEPQVHNAFEDINLGGDTPQLDLNFGTDAGIKGSGAGFGFGAGGWGSSWDTGNRWGFGGTGNGATDTADLNKDASEPLEDTGAWSFGKKNKKTTTTASGFDFGDLGNLDEGGEPQANAGGDQDEWTTGFTAANKKGKKNKKNVIEDSSNATDTTAIGTAVTEPTTADDSWSPWGASTSKKDKNKKKKNEPEPPMNDVPLVPPPPPPAPPAEPSADDMWNSFGTKPKKKNNKKGAIEEPTKVEEPIVVVPEPEAEADVGWGSFGNKKDKKKGKKDAAEEKKFEPEPVVVVGDAESEFKAEPDLDWGFSSKKEKKKGKKDADDDKSQKPAVAEPQKDDDLDLGWGGFGTGKKDTKKGKKDATEGSKAPITVVPDPEPEPSFGWGGFGTKKVNKKGKKAVEEDQFKVDDIAPVVTDPDPISGMGWGSFGNKKDQQKAPAGAFEDYNEELDFGKGPELDAVVEDSFGAGWGSTTKKGKKDKKGGIMEVKEDTFSALGSVAATEAANKTADDDWTNWAGDKKKDKKGKKGLGDATKEEALPPPPPPVPEVPAASSTDIWGSSKKDKKGKKGKITSEPEPAIVQVPEPPPPEKEEVIEEDWGNFGLSPKDKKKKEKEKEKQKKEQEANAKKELEELEMLEKEEAERKEREEKEKEKIKSGKKGKASATTATSKAKDLLAGSVPDTSTVAEDDFTSSIWGSSKKDSKKKTGKKESALDVPPPVPTPPAQGLTPPPEDDLDDLIDGGWGSFGTAKDTNKKDIKKLSKADELKASKTTSKDKADEQDKKAKEETPAKAARSFWGGMASTSTGKSKSTKEKEKEKDKTANDLDLDAYLDPDEIVDIIEEEPPPKKGSKSKTGDSKISKTASKDDKASKASASDKKAKAGAEIDALLDDFDEFDETSKTAETGKGKAEEKKSDAWGFWGSSKKTSGKKGDEPKKEINKQETTNQVDALAFLSNEPEASPIADEPAQSLPSKPFKSAMSASKTSGKLSVAQKVKALEEEKKKALEKALQPPAPPPPPVAEPEIEPPAKKSLPASKSRGAATSKFASASKRKDKDPSPPPEEEKKQSRDSVPGSFPAEGNDEENLIDMLASTPVDKKSAKKGAKTAKKEPPKDFMDLDVPVVPAAPPTPPAEPVAPKPVKKERARVVRDQGASSWGFWGAAPKKDDKKAAKAKDDTDVPPAKKTATPALVRSKSTKTPKEKDKDIEKSSSSDAKEKKAESRPSKSRGSSFGALFSGPPPARAKPVRRMSTSAASKTTSKRQSMDIDGFGLPSPPPDDAPAVNGKAAKLMGTTSAKLDRKASSKGKQKAAAIPDPYPIDDDDMVMVNGMEDPIVNAPIPKASGKSSRDKNSRTKPRKEFKSVVDAGDDVVMVDGPSPEEPELLAFDEKPRDPAPLRRSMTSAKKSQNGKLMSLFGGFGKTRRNSETLERSRTKATITDDEAISPRKRTVNGREDSSKRIRRDDRKVRRPEKQGRDAEVFVTDALNEGGATTEFDETQIRRQERRAKREGRDSEDRRAHRRDVEKVADDSRKGKTSERRAKREEDRPHKESVERSKHSSSRPHKSDRRRSYMESPLTGDRPKAHRSRTEQSSRKRQSVAAPEGIDDYFDSRNAAAEGVKNEPYMHGANDHTSSWVKSQLSDPADPPPVEGTVIEPAPELGGKGGYEKGEEDARRAARKARRQSRYGPEDELGETDRERRHRKKEKGSEGSAEWGAREREKLSRRYTDMGGSREAPDARPSLGAAGKRGSWLKKVTGLGT
ncbi:MAG: hypothetical protein Q9216_004047 [Gyalolechia sp. 2 TL-2023]